jgi:ribonuclease Z
MPITPNTGSLFHAETQAAALASTSDVKQLVSTHISGRYSDEEILAEATKTFPNSRIAADLDRIVI